MFWAAGSSPASRLSRPDFPSQLCWATAPAESGPQTATIPQVQAACLVPPPSVVVQIRLATPTPGLPIPSPVGLTRLPSRFQTQHRPLRPRGAPVLFAALASG